MTITSGNSVAIARPIASVFSATPGPDVVVIVLPGIEHEAGMGQRREQRLVEMA